MPDGTSRFSLRGKPVAHYMGTSTFANYTVLPEIALARIRKDAPFDKVCYIGCGVTTGIGAVLYTAEVEAGARCVVFGLGGIGLNVIQGLRLVGADQIVGVDVNPAKQALAERFGMTHFVNPSEVPGRPRAAPGRAHRRRRRLLLRVHRQREDDAPGPRVLSPRLGRVDRHRRRRRGGGDRDAALPARHGSRLAGQRLRRGTRAHRRAAHRGLVHETARSRSTS